MLLKYYYEPFSNLNLRTDLEQKLPIPKNVSSVMESNRHSVVSTYCSFGTLELWVCFGKKHGISANTVA